MYINESGELLTFLYTYIAYICTRCGTLLNCVTTLECGTTFNGIVIIL